MYKKAVILILVWFSFSGLANAQILITEVRISPSENRFIELYNSGDVEVDLTGWFIQRKTATGASFGSLVTSTKLQGKVVPPKGYFLISRTNIPDSDLVVEDLTLTASNAIQVKNSANVVDKIAWGESSECIPTCSPDPGENESLQRNIDNAWIIGSPSPGTGAQAQPEEPPVVSVSSPTKPTTVLSLDKKKIITKISAPKTIFAGVPVKLQATTYGLDDEIVFYGTYFWNFGDGDSRKSNPTYTSEKFTHTYEYPGDYTIFLEYYKGHFGEVPDSVAEVFIKVVPTDVSISSVGDEKNFFIEISNDTEHKADISNWYLVSGSKSFMFPKNTNIESNKKLRLSPKLTGFEYVDKESLSLLGSAGNLVYEYKPVSLPKKINVSTIPKSTPVVLQDEEVFVPEVITASVPKEEEKRMPVIAFSVLLMGSGALLYYMRTKGEDLEG